MNTITRKRITYYMPGTFFPEHDGDAVESFDIPKTVPLDCYAFEFSETEFAIGEDGKEFVGETKKDQTLHYIGWNVPLANIPQDGKHDILRSNIEFNSPTKTAVRTHLGNWQPEMENTVTHDPKEFTFSEPRIWKKIKQIEGPAAQ